MDKLFDPFASVCMQTMSGPTTISSSGEDAITQVIDVQQQSISETGVPFDESYEIDSTVDEIVRGGYERVSDDQRACEGGSQL